MAGLNYGDAFGFFFKEAHWLKKLVIASLLTCTLIGAAPVIGWTIEIARRVAADEKPTVPEFKNWKSFWTLGGKFALVNAAWLLPFLLATIIIYLPLIMINRLADEAVLGIFGGTFLCVFLFLLVYSFVYVFFIPVMMVVLVRSGSTRQAMNPITLWRTARPRFTEYLVVFLIVGLGLLNLMILIAPLTLFLLLPAMMVYATLVTAHFSGQLAKPDA